MKKINTNFVVRESIAKALFALLETKKLEDITIKELTTKAGVGRVSFYRNFDSKEDVIMQFLNILLERMMEDIEQSELKKGHPDIISYIFKYFYQEKYIILLLYKNNLSYLILKSFREYLGPKETETNIEAYFSGFRYGATFGWIDEWINRGMQETPEQMSSSLSKFKQKLDSQ